MTDNTDNSVILGQFIQVDDRSPAANEATITYQLNKTTVGPQTNEWCGWQFDGQYIPTGWFRMNAWVKFLDQVPPTSDNLGFKLQGTTFNGWVSQAQANEWKFVSKVVRVHPFNSNPISNLAAYIFDSMAGP